MEKPGKPGNSRVFQVYQVLFWVLDRRWNSAFVIYINLIDFPFFADFAEGLHIFSLTSISVFSLFAGFAEGL